MRAEWGRRKLLFEDSQRVLQACTIVFLDSIFFVKCNRVCSGQYLNGVHSHAVRRFEWMESGTRMCYKRPKLILV